jgi:hypothetical protein
MQGAHLVNSTFLSTVPSSAAKSISLIAFSAHNFWSLGKRFNFEVQPFAMGARIVQSVQRLATGWTTEVSEFESQ